MKTNQIVSSLGVLLAVFLLAAPAAAQEGTEGIDRGNYNVKQSFEAGWRFTDFDGSRPVFLTFVNLNEGFRLFQHNLEMRSLDHQGVLFDDFYLSSFGYGGDPNAVSRLRAYKNKWYNFSATFRLDRNTWDYNLLANPLNPSTSNPTFDITQSPHRMELVRRLSDYNLTLMPQSRVRLRVGYARNISEGPSFITPRLGTETIAFQDWKTTLNAYSFGVDFRVLPRTNFSYDQFFHAYKGDTTWLDTIGATQLGMSRFFAQLSTGQPVDLGIIFNTASGQPCSAPITSTATTPPTASPTCNAFLLYDLAGNVRTLHTTEQFSFQSSYIRNVDVSGRLIYSSSDNDLIGFQERFEGRSSRTNQRQFTASGPAAGKRVSVTSDFGVSWQVTEKLRFMNSFQFQHFRIPGSFAFAQLNFFATSMLNAPNIFTPGSAPPASCPTTTSAGCPQHSSNSPADVIAQQFTHFLGQNTKFNHFEVDYHFTRRFGARLGYRFRTRDIRIAAADTSNLHYFPTLPNRGACAGQPLLPDGSCRVITTSSHQEEESINEHSALIGVWARPADQFRMNLDVELMSADRSFTRISPRHLQRYRFRSTYRPAQWASVGFAFNILEKRNNVVEIAHKQHNRSYGFSVVLEPNNRFGLDFGYDFNDIFSQTNICFVGSLQPPGTTPCPTAAALLQQVSLYEQDAHYGHFNVMWKPVPRLQTTLGYAVVSTTGQTLILTPNAPPGPLQYNYHRPHASIAFDLGQGFTWRTSWGYYGYNEKALPDPTGPRDFRGNLFELAIRYGF